jgi:hypothetical protein
MKYWHDEHFDDILNKNNNQQHTVAEDENIQFIEGPTVEDIDPPPTPPCFKNWKKLLRSLKIIRHRQQTE